MPDVRTIRIPIMYDDKTGPGRSAVQRGLKGLEKTSGRTTSTMQRQWETLRRHQLAAAAAITGAILAIRAAWEGADQAAVFLEQRAAVEGLGRQYGQTADEIIGHVQRMARGLINLRDAADVSARSLALGFGPEQIGQLISVGERYTDVIGGSAAEATNRLAKAIATQEVEMTKTMGLYVQTNKVMEQYAETVGKTKEQLTNAERTQAFYNEVMRQTQVVIGQLGPAIDTVKDKMDGLMIALEDYELQIHTIFTVRLPLAILATVNAMTVEINAIKLAVLTTIKIVEPLYKALGGNTEDLNAMIANTAVDLADSIAEVSNAIDLLYSDLENMASATANSVQATVNAAVGNLTIPDPFGDVEYAEDPRLVREREFLREMELAWGEFTAKINRMRQENAEKEAADFAERYQIASGFAGSLATLFHNIAQVQGKHQDESLFMYKMFAVAQATIDAHKAYTATLGATGFFGHLTALTAFAMAIARIPAILAVQPGSGPTSPPPAAPGYRDPQTSSDSSPRDVSVTVNITGTFANSDAAARAIVPYITKAVKDGVG